MITKYKFMHIFHALNLLRKPVPLLENYREISKPMLFANQTYRVCKNTQLGWFFCCLFCCCWGLLVCLFERALLRILQEQRTYCFNISFTKIPYFFNAKFLWFPVCSFFNNQHVYNQSKKRGIKHVVWLLWKSYNKVIWVCGLSWQPN